MPAHTRTGTMSLCQADELMVMCQLGASVHKGCMFTMEEDPFNAEEGPALLGLKDAQAHFSTLDRAASAASPPIISCGSQSEDEDEDLLWCPSPSAPASRVVVPTHTAAGGPIKCPELSSSSNSDSSMCTAFELGGAVPAASVRGAVAVPLHISDKLHSTEAGAALHKHSSPPAVTLHPTQQLPEGPPTAKAGGPFITHPMPFGHWQGPSSVQQPGSLAHPTPLSIPLPASPEASKGEGGGRISPNNLCVPDGQAVVIKQEQQPTTWGEGLLGSSAPSSLPHSGSMQGLATQQQQPQQQQPQPQRQTKRTPIPSVRLQRMMEGEGGPVNQRRAQGSRKKHGGASVKRGASTEGEQPHTQQHPHSTQQQHAQQQQESYAPLSSQGAGDEADRRIKPRLQQDDNKFGSGLWGSSEPVGFTGPFGGSASALHDLDQQAPLWLSSSAPASSLFCADRGEGVALPGQFVPVGEMGVENHMHHTDLMEVAAELAAAAEKEGAGHGIRGPPTFLHNPSPYPRAPLNYHTTNTTQHTTSKHARLQSLGNRSLNATATTHRPRAHSNAHHNSASAPLPAAHAHAHTHAAARRVVPAIGAEYDGHEDSEDGTPQVPPPRFPAGQPHGVPRPPARVLVPHPTGGCCTACKVNATPVWRTGPHGPKTLCNACGVRYTKVVRKK